jgi:membrane associated rhomboid family serine protease
MSYHKSTVSFDTGKQLPYIDEDSSLKNPEESPLVHNAADVGRSDNFRDLEYAEPHGDDQKSSPVPEKTLPGWFPVVRFPIEQRIEDKKRGIGRQRYPFVVWALSTVMVAVFIYELVVNARAQGTPVSFKPVVNPMLGPSSSALINVGARFPPCMKLVEAVPPSLQLGCLNNTANPPDELCSLETICGFGGFRGNNPNQWFRFITPIFLHAGFVHILLNLFAQLFISAQIEREMGSGGFFLTYFAAGIFGNILGGNFALVGIPSVGASGAIFGTVAVTWVDLLAHWKYQYRPVRKLIFMIIELLIGVAIGFIPYVDNFVHLGGFLMGLLVGMIFYPIISVTKRHRLVVWSLRLLAIPLTIILFVVLTRNFYTSDPYAACSWCRYLSCIPIAANNRCQGTGLTITSTSS